MHPERDIADIAGIFRQVGRYLAARNWLLERALERIGIITDHRPPFLDDQLRRNHMQTEEARPSITEQANAKK